MNITKVYGVTLVGNTYRNDNGSLSLTIPTNLIKDCIVGNSLVLTSKVEIMVIKVQLQYQNYIEKSQQIKFKIIFHIILY